MTSASHPDSSFLLSRGWRERKSSSPWRWELKKLPGALYQFKDAVSVQKAMDKKKGKQIA